MLPAEYLCCPITSVVFGDEASVRVYRLGGDCVTDCSEYPVVVYTELGHCITFAVLHIWYCTLKFMLADEPNDGRFDVDRFAWQITSSPFAAR